MSMRERLRRSVVEEKLASMELAPFWRVAGGEQDDGALVLERTYGLRDWRAVMLFANAIAYLAEVTDHHPDLTLSWRKLVVRLTSHDVNGVTERDLTQARRIEALGGEDANGRLIASKNAS